MWRGVSRSAVQRVDLRGWADLVGLVESRGARFRPAWERGGSARGAAPVTFPHVHEARARRPALAQLTQKEGGLDRSGRHGPMASTPPRHVPRDEDGHDPEDQAE
jgi:hypothetical protein